MKIQKDNGNGVRWVEHTCDKLKAMDSGGYGVAVDMITQGEGGWEMSNGEYSSYPIFFCPCCGVELIKETLQNE